MAFEKVAPRAVQTDAAFCINAAPHVRVARQSATTVMKTMARKTETLKVCRAAGCLRLSQRVRFGFLARQGGVAQRALAVGLATRRAGEAAEWVQAADELEFLDEKGAEMNPLEGGNTLNGIEESFGPVERDPLLPLVLAVVRAGDERKARDVVAMRVAPLTIVTSFFVFLSAASAPQLRAIVNNIEAELIKRFDTRATRVAGTADSGWMLLDYGDIMVHVFHTQQRAFYSLETRWAAGERVDLSSVLAPADRVGLAPATATALDDWDDDVSIDDNGADDSVVEEIWDANKDDASAQNIAVRGAHKERQPKQQQQKRPLDEDWV